jgi:AAA15 family ATPase/GTPase
MIKHIKLKDFKKVELFETDLGKINVLVGGNNSGKSSVLHGIHFSILAEAARRMSGNKTVPMQDLFYLPVHDFTLLRHGSPYTNYSGSKSTLYLRNDDVDENDNSISITIYKGRNIGNIGIECSPNNSFRRNVTSYNEFYSIYVPGISGIPLNERLESWAVIKSASANGDANMYLRNVLYYIKMHKKLDELNDFIKKIFPETSISIPYDPEKDINIRADILFNGSSLPLELSGTGFLQIVQIMAYALCFSPKLLLLDEPDEHLHPVNQELLVDTLKILAEQKNIQIIISTHSRHMLLNLDNDARFIWMQDGKIKNPDATCDIYQIMLDIGALDAYDKVISGRYTCVFLTEDKDHKYLKKILEYNGYDLDKTFLLSYKGCGNIELALQLADFIHRGASDILVVIHRDRDFMTEEETKILKERIQGNKTFIFVTRGADVESYFVQKEHLAELFSKPVEEIEKMLINIATENHVKIQETFSNKRREIGYSFIYRDKNRNQPNLYELFGTTLPTNLCNITGKYMLKKINEAMNGIKQERIDLTQETKFLITDELQDILRQIS